MALHPKQFGMVLKNARMDKKLTQIGKKGSFLHRKFCCRNEPLKCREKVTETPPGYRIHLLL